jgi:Family of unknown function (DUF6627)
MDYQKGRGGKGMRNPLKKSIIWYLVVAMFIIGITPRAYAGFSPSEGIAYSSAVQVSELPRIQKSLEMKMIRERLKELGLSPEEIQGRLNRFSDPQSHQLALKIDDLKAGGDEGLAIVVLLLGVAVAVIIILQATGHQVVVKK